MNWVWELGFKNNYEKDFFESEVWICLNNFDLTYSKSSDTWRYFLQIRPNYNNPRRQTIYSKQIQIKAKDLIKELKWFFTAERLENFFIEANKERKTIPIIR